MTRKYSGFNTKDEFVMSEFDANYTFKGFEPSQFKKVSNKYVELVGKHVSDDNNQAIIKVADSQYFQTKYGFALIVDAKHVVFFKSWQLFGEDSHGNVFINFNRNYYTVKEFGDFSDNFGEGSDIETFDGVVALAKEQEEYYNTNSDASFDFKL